MNSNARLIENTKRNKVNRNLTKIDEFSVKQDDGNNSELSRNNSNINSDNNLIPNHQEDNQSSKPTKQFNLHNEKNIIHNKTDNNKTNHVVSKRKTSNKEINFTTNTYDSDNDKSNSVQLKHYIPIDHSSKQSKTTKSFKRRSTMENIHLQNDHIKEKIFELNNYPLGALIIDDKYIIK